MIIYACNSLDWDGPLADDTVVSAEESCYFKVLSGDMKSRAFLEDLLIDVNR